MMADPDFTSRDELAQWAKQRIRFPDPAPDAKLKALEDIRRVTLNHADRFRDCDDCDFSTVDTDCVVCPHCRGSVG